MLVSTFLYSLWYVGRVSVAALIANLVENFGSLLMVARICGTDNSIIRTVFRSRVASLLAMSSSRFFSTSQLEGCRDATQD